MSTTVHDWTRVDDGTFHDFHGSWITYLKDALNAGVLQPPYFARSEQHFAGRIADVLTLRERVPGLGTANGRHDPAPPAGSVAAVVAPPQALVSRTLYPSPLLRQRSIAVRHAESGTVVALIEIMSPANKDRPESVDAFVAKVTDALNARVHVVVVDLLGPNKHCLAGLDQAICNDLRLPPEDRDDIGRQPADRPVALLSYESKLPEVGAYLNFLRVGDPIPDVPLFLTRGHYVPLPLAGTYDTTFRALPRVTRDVLAPPG